MVQEKIELHNSYLYLTKFYNRKEKMVMPKKKLAFK